MRESRFAAYVDAARNGKNALWRILLSAAIIAAIWFAGSFASVYGAAVFILIRDGISPQSFYGVFTLIDLANLAGDRIWPFVMLLSITPLWLAVSLVVKVIHRRPLRGVLGIGGRLYWPDFARSALVTLVVSLVIGPIALLIDPTVVRGSASLSGWLAAAPLLLVILFLQT